MSRGTATPDLWTTRRLLAWMGKAFADKGLDSPRLMGEMLVAHVIGCDRLRLYTDPDRPASPLERHRLRELVARALKHEPVQYLVGEAWFFGLAFRVDPRVLVPRPATETIVEHVLQHARVQPGFGGPRGEGVLIGDVCTGSGCIAVALLKRLPGARGVASDVSGEALRVAGENAARHGVGDRLDLVRGDMLGPILAHPTAGRRGALHYLVSNPPYIPDDEWEAVPANVKGHEPHLALRGGVDGLDFVRRVVAGGADLVRVGGLMLIEVADSRAGAALELMRGAGGMAGARILNDFEGLPRVVVARREG